MINPDFILNLTFSAFIIIMIVFYFNDILKNCMDIFFAISAIITSLIILISKNDDLIDFAHFSYNSFFIIPAAFFSKNKYFLSLNALIIFNTMISRFYYNKCLLNEKQNYTGITHDLSSYINFNWDYVYLILLIINIIRLVHLVK
jgi:hypothetical protein